MRLHSVRLARPVTLLGHQEVVEFSHRYWTIHKEGDEVWIDEIPRQGKHASAYTDHLVVPWSSVLSAEPLDPRPGIAKEFQALDAVIRRDPLIDRVLRWIVAFVRRF